MQTFQQDATSLPNQGTQVLISSAVSTQILQHRVLPSGNVYLQERLIQRPQPDVISTGNKNYQGHFQSNIPPQGNMHLLNQPALESLQPRKWQSLKHPEGHQPAINNKTINKYQNISMFL